MNRDLILSGANIRLGGSDPVRVVPNINSGKWSDEAWINLNYAGMVNPAVSENPRNGAIRLSKGIEHIELWPLNNNVLETKIILDDRPPRDFFIFNLQHSNNLSFAKQLPLTQDDIDDGCFRPNNVINSYAVYINKGHNQYQTGKVVHLYRWICTDSNGIKSWCDMDINGGVLKIIADKTYLDNASYPVEIMGAGDTIGFSTAGGTNSSQTTSNPSRGSLFNPYTAVTGDICTELWLYINGSAAPQTAGAALYSNVTAVSTMNGATRAFAEQSISYDNPEAWYSKTGLSFSLTAGNVYDIAIGNRTSTVGFFYDTLTTGASTGGDNTLPATWTQAGTQNRKYSMYAVIANTVGSKIPIPLINNSYKMKRNTLLRM